MCRCVSPKIIHDRVDADNADCDVNGGRHGVSMSKKSQICQICDIYTNTIFFYNCKKIISNDIVRGH